MKDTTITPKTVLIFLADLALNLIIIVGLVFLIRTYIISPFQVYGPSMCDTMNHIDGKCAREYGEYIIVDKFSYQNFFGWQVGTPQRGDIIVFHPPNKAEEFYIKRVIGVPGDTIEVLDGRVKITNKKSPQGKFIDEPYLNEKNKDSTFPQQFGKTEFKVPEGKYFVMGDNRVESTDSRSCFNQRFSGGCDNATAFLDSTHIQGKAWVSLWPLSKIRFVEHAEYSL